MTVYTPAHIQLFLNRNELCNESRASYRALGAVFDVVDSQFNLRLLVDVGLLEEGDAAEEDGVTGALLTKK